jgi:hypothetical protein
MSQDHGLALAPGRGFGEMSAALLVRAPGNDRL